MKTIKPRERLDEKNSGPLVWRGPKGPIVTCGPKKRNVAKKGERKNG